MEPFQGWARAGTYLHILLLTKEQKEHGSLQPREDRASLRHSWAEQGSFQGATLYQPHASTHPGQWVMRLYCCPSPGQSLELLPTLPSTQSFLTVPGRWVRQKVAPLAPPSNTGDHRRRFRSGQTTGVWTQGYPPTSVACPPVEVVRCPTMGARPSSKHHPHRRCLAVEKVTTVDGDIAAWPMEKLGNREEAA